MMPDYIYIEMNRNHWFIPEMVNICQYYLSILKPIQSRYHPVFDQLNIRPLLGC